MQAYYHVNAYSENYFRCSTQVMPIDNRVEDKETSPLLSVLVELVTRLADEAIVLNTCIPRKLLKKQPLPKRRTRTRLTHCWEMEAEYLCGMRGVSMRSPALFALLHTSIHIILCSPITTV